VNERSSSGRLTSQSVQSSLSPGSDSGSPADVEAEMDDETELLTDGDTEDEAELLADDDGEDDTEDDAEPLVDEDTEDDTELEVELLGDAGAIIQ
jgi:pilus assembly protein FimV